MQKQIFKDEIKLLEDPKFMKTLDLVNNINIFKDNENLLRVGEIISKSQNINFDLAYPMLLSKKNHPLIN